MGTSGADGSEAFKSKLKFQVQHEVFRVKVREGRIGEITEILAWYEYINDGEEITTFWGKGHTNSPSTPSDMHSF